MIARELGRNILGIRTPAVFGVLALSIFFGLLCALMGNIIAERPMFFVALPVLIALGVTFYIDQKALVVIIIMFRAAADPVFQNTGFGNVSGLGGVVNLAIIVIAFVFVLKDPKRVPRQAWLAWLPFIFLRIVGLMHAPDTYQESRHLLAQLSTFAIFIAAFYVVEDFQSMEKALRLILASSVPVMVMTLAFISSGITYSSIEGAETISGRYAGPFPHPNILAFYTTLIIALNLYLIKKDGNSILDWKILFGFIYMIILFGVLYATKTRSAWLATAALFVIFGLFFERRYLLYLLLVLAFAMLIPEFRDRIFDLNQGNFVVQYARLNSFAWRQLAWKDALLWMDPIRYFLGYGNGGFTFYSPIFNSMGGAGSFGAHNVLVELFFDVGLFGVVAYLWIFLSCFKMIRVNAINNNILEVISASLLMMYILISLSDNMLHYLVYNWYFWFFIGAVCTVMMRAQAGCASDNNQAASNPARSNISSRMGCA
jgi:hypothetical protein